MKILLAVLESKLNKFDGREINALIQKTRNTCGVVIPYINNCAHAR